MQITFVMLIFPLVMNGMQYYIIDSFIKDPAGGEAYSEVEQRDEDGENEGLISAARRRDEEDEDAAVGTEDRLKEANPTPMPVEYDSDGETRVGSSGSTAVKAPRS